MIQPLHHILVLFLGCLLTACAARLHDSSKWLADPPTRPPLETARDGKIQVFISGDARKTGSLWISEKADILMVEAMAGAGDEGPAVLEPKYVVIRREVDGRILELRYDLIRRSQPEKQKIHLKHGDAVVFPRSNCW